MAQPLLDDWVKNLEEKEAGGFSQPPPIVKAPLETMARVTQAVIERLPPDQQRATIDRMSPEQFSSWVRNLPPDQKDKLGPLMDQTSSPEKKLIMWGETYKGEAYDMAAAAHAELNAPGTTPERAKELNRIIEASSNDMKEADREVAAMSGEWTRNGGPGLNDIEDLKLRKAVELEMEQKRGINITDETANLAEAKAGGKLKWKEDELRKLDKELAHLPPHMRPYIPEYHRATSPNGDGGMWDGNRLNCYSDNPGVWRHEMAHAIDSADDEGKAPGTSASERYKSKMGWQKYDDETALKTALLSKMSEAEADAKIQELKNAPGRGNYGQQSVEIDGVVYQHYGGRAGFSAYDARRVPRRGHAEKTEQDGSHWEDHYDYARQNEGQNPEHFYEEHVNNALADPLRIHSDFVQRPDADVARLERELRARHERGEDTSGTQAELDEAKKTRDDLREQYDLVRESLGVTPSSIDAAAAGLTDVQKEAFKKQADRVSSGEQLKKLRETWADGTAIGTQNVVNRGDKLRAYGFNDDQIRAFEDDAMRCFTREQLDAMTDRYISGERKYGEWDPSKLKHGNESLGY